MEEGVERVDSLVWHACDLDCSTFSASSPFACPNAIQFLWRRSLSELLMQKHGSLKCNIPTSLYSLSPPPPLPTPTPTPITRKTRTPPPPPRTPKPPPRTLPPRRPTPTRTPPPPRRRTPTRRVTPRPVTIPLVKPIPIPTAPPTPKSTRRTPPITLLRSGRDRPAVRAIGRGTSRPGLAHAMRFAESIGRRSAGRRGATKPSPWQDDADAYQSAVELRLVHVRNRGFGVGGGGVEDVGDAAVGHELLVHRHFEFGDVAVGAEDFVEVRRVDVFG